MNQTDPHLLHQLIPADAATISGPRFFPGLLNQPFRSGLHEAFGFAICACLVAAAASWSRGARYLDDEQLDDLRAVPPAGAELSPD